MIAKNIYSKSLAVTIAAAYAFTAPSCGVNVKSSGNTGRAAAQIGAANSIKESQIIPKIQN